MPESLPSKTGKGTWHFFTSWGVFSLYENRYILPLAVYLFTALHLLTSGKMLSPLEGMK